MSKRRVIILLCLALCFLSINFVYSYEQNFTYAYSGNTADASVKITSLKYEPYPVEPGELLKIHLILENTGSDYADNATCMIVNKQPFTAYRERKKSIGKLAPGREFAFDFEVYVDSNAFERTEYLEIQCTDNPANDFWIVEKIPIEIRLRYAVFDIVSVKTTPETLKMGKQANLTLTFINNAETPIRDISAEISVTDVPISPVNGITIKKIKNIDKNDKANVTFNILVEPDAESGFYKVPLIVNYVDGAGEQRNFSSVITLIISEKPAYYVTVESYERVSEGKKITLKFVNYGPEDLKFFNAKVLDSSGIKVKSNNQIYIGDLDSDDYLTETFTAKISSKAIIPLEITYKDAINNDYLDYVNVTWDESKVTSTTEESIWTKIIVVILIVIVGYYLYRTKIIKFSKSIEV